ncbi:MAG: hypothetical protein V1717_03485 [Candidatus Micrarchaeota archaeon]
MPWKGERGLVAMDFSKNAFILLFLLLSQFAFASQLSISPKSLSACPCDPLYYDLGVYSEEDDVFKMNFQSDYGFSTFLQPQVPVPALSSIKTTLVLNSACDAPSGNYSFSVTASGKHSQASVEGYAVVKSCKNLVLEIPAKQSVCAGSAQNVLVSLRNSGLVNENGKIVFDNLPKAFYYLADDEFDLKPGESKKFLVSIQPPFDTPPSSFTYTAFANNAVAKVGLEIMDCSFVSPSKVEVTASLNSVEFCAGKSKTISFDIRNEGQSAEFKLESSGISGSFPVEKITVPGKTNRSISFNINAVGLTAGTKTLTVDVLGPSSSDSATVNIVLKDCPSTVFGELELCLGESGSIPFSFRNTNPSTQNYVFTTTSSIPSRVEPNSTAVGPNQAVSASLFVTGSALGVFPVFVYANQSLLRAPKVIVKSCEAPAPAEVFEKNFTLEANAWQTAFIQANTNVQNATLSMPSEFEVSNVHGGQDKVFFDVRPSREGNFTLPVSISVNGIKLEKAFAFNIVPASVEILEKSHETISEENGFLRNTATFSVFNKGQARLVITPFLTAEGAEFEPKELELNAGEEKELTVSYSAVENQSIGLSLSAEGKVYSIESVAVKTPLASTGFFTATRAIGIFAVLIVIAIIVLAFVLKKEFEGMEKEDSEEKKAAEDSPQKKKK